MARYEEIAADLRDGIHRGEYAPGRNLPGYEALCDTYGVGRGVIRQALDVLEAEGLIRVAKKRGIVVRERGERRRITRGNLVTRNTRVGYVFPAASDPDEPWVAHGRPTRADVPVPGHVADLLGVDAGARVLRRRRVTSPAGEPPFQIVDTWLHPEVIAEVPQVAEADTGPGGYLDRLEEAGHGPIRWEEILRTRTPEPDEARLLEIPTSLPVLELARVGTSARTRATIEVSVCIIPADRVEIISSLQRDTTAQWPVAPVQPPS